MGQHTPKPESFRAELATRLFPQTREQILTRMPERSGFCLIEKPVPFAADLTNFVLAKGIQLAPASKPYVTPYRGFDLNRRGDNLVTEPEFGTGFEGYGIGRYDNGEDIVLEVAQMGKREIDYLKRMHPQSWRNIMNEVWATLDGKQVTPRALDVLNRMLISCLHQGRRQISNNRAAQQFRENTMFSVSSATEVGYYYDDTAGKVINLYYRAVERRSLSGIQVHRFGGNPTVLLQSDTQLLEGWRLMDKLGMMGQMAVRAVGAKGYLQYGLGAMAESISRDSR